MFHKFYCTLLLICGILSSAVAQICQGSLGDPIVNTTFGSGANPGPRLSAATTNYQYASTDCPKDGYYAVRNKTENCFDTTWYTVTDHTGDSSGYFMLVNASYDPGAFYLDTVRGLCPGSTYEFAAWVINVKRPVICWGASQIINPDITFRIERTDGTLLQSYTTGSITSANPPQWKQYGFFFTTPAGVSDIVIRMVNNAPGGCGNDLGLDDITFRPCGPRINAIIASNGSASDTLCEGTAGSYTLTAQASPGYINPTYQWQQDTGGDWQNIPGATSQNYTVNYPAGTAPGNYVYRVITAEAGNINSPKCRVASQPVTIIVAERPSLSLSGNSPVCAGAQIELSASAASGQVSWTGPGGFTATGNQVVRPGARSEYAGTYYATVNTGRCSRTDSIGVMIRPGPAVTVDTDTTRICEGDSALLRASGAATYSWAPATGLSGNGGDAVSASPTATTVYTVTGRDADGCSDTATVSVRVMRKPRADAGPDRAIVKGSGIQLNGMAGGDSIRYFWTPDYAITGIQSLNPTVSPLTDTFYVLHVESTAGCGQANDTTRVTLYKTLEIPNAFSPNGDNINDRWMIPGLLSYPGASLALFDRYGREILRKTNFEGWDGKRNSQPVPPAVYYYVIDLRNGNPKITGWVYLTR